MQKFDVLVAFLDALHNLPLGIAAVSKLGSRFEPRL